MLLPPYAFSDTHSVLLMSGSYILFYLPSPLPQSVSELQGWVVDRRNGLPPKFLLHHPFFTLRVSSRSHRDILFLSNGTSTTTEWHFRILILKEDSPCPSDFQQLPVFLTSFNWGFVELYFSMPCFLLSMLEEGEYSAILNKSVYNQVYFK